MIDHRCVELGGSFRTIRRTARFLGSSLEGKLALVSGSTAGIGLGIARGLAKLGATVAINGRELAKVEAAIAKLQAENPKATFLAAPGDLATAEGAKKVIDAIPTCDVLVNNTGIFEQKDFFEIPDEDWERLFQVNVMSGVRLARHYTPKMLEKKWGRVIFISSESGLHCPAAMVHCGFGLKNQ
jgi:NAD(P)-dependent dehydrogenase (short-subunit alcohol dehydrogenase family)